MTTTPPTSEPPKKGMSGLAIFGIGCAGLIVLAVIAVGILMMKGCSMVKNAVAEAQKNPAKASATWMLKMNPDVEILNDDDAKGEITFKDKKTGEVLTMSFNEVSQGKFKVKNAKGEESVIDASDVGKKGFSFKGPDGELVVGGSKADASLPLWVPVYPGAQIEEGGVFSRKGETVTGLFSSSTVDGIAKVKEFYDSQFKAGGYSTELNTFSVNGAESATVSATKSPAQKATVMINAQGGKTRITIQYEGSKK